jgi:hypothetical protein
MEPSVKGKHFKSGQRKAVLGSLRKVHTYFTLPIYMAGNLLPNDGIDGINTAYQSDDFGFNRTKHVHVLELWGGTCGISKAAHKLGYTVAQPFDLIYGDDLTDAQIQAQVMDYIDRVKPDLVVMGPPCTKWSALQSINYRDDPRALQRARRQELPSLRLAEAVFVKQHAGGRAAVIEHPLTAASWDQAC